VESRRIEQGMTLIDANKYGEGPLNTRNDAKKEGGIGASED